MPTHLQEFTTASAAHLRVDREASVLRSVKLLGLTSTNGRRYLVSALREAMPLYETAKVNVNHGKGGPLGPREYQDRLGVIRNVTFREGEGLFGDLHYNPKHALAEQLVWDAEHAPQNVGLSHNVLAHTSSRTVSRDGSPSEETIVERIEKVQSVDVVADPATTRGLFEATEFEPQPASHDRSAPDQDAEVDPSQSATAAEHAEASPEAAEATDFAARARLICELLHEHELPLPGDQSQAARRIISEAFFDALWKAPSDGSLRELVENRAALVDAAQTWRRDAVLGEVATGAASRPTSRDQFAAALGVPVVQEPGTAQAFVEAIKGG